MLISLLDVKFFFFKNADQLFYRDVFFFFRLRKGQEKRKTPGWKP